MTVIAHYRKRPLLLLILLLVLFEAVACLLSVLLFRAERFQLHPQGSMLLRFLVFWAALAFLTILPVTLLRRVFRQNGMAVWIEAGRLFFGTRIDASLSCREITLVAVERPDTAKYAEVALYMLDGGRKRIPMKYLWESPEIVAARIRAAL